MGSWGRRWLTHFEGCPMDCLLLGKKPVTPNTGWSFFFIYKFIPLLLLGLKMIKHDNWSYLCGERGGRVAGTMWARASQRRGSSCCCSDSWSTRTQSQQTEISMHITFGIQKSAENVTSNDVNYSMIFWNLYKEAISKNNLLYFYNAVIQSNLVICISDAFQWIELGSNSPW